MSQSFIVLMSGEREALRSHALRVLLLGHSAQDALAGAAAFEILDDALRGGMAVANDAHIFGPALAQYAC